MHLAISLAKHSACADKSWYQGNHANWTQTEGDEDMTNMLITIWNVIKITKKVEERNKNVHIKLEAFVSFVSEVLVSFVSFVLWYLSC
jgi:hypothetical protein